MSENVVLSCPGCGMRFSAPLEQFAPAGRQVRCSQCKHMWFHALPMREDGRQPKRVVRTAPKRPEGMAGPDAVAAPEAEDAKGAQEAVPPVDPRSEWKPVSSTGISAQAPRETEHAQDGPHERGGGFAALLLWLVALLLLAAILAYVFSGALRAAVPQAAPWLDRYTSTVDTTAQGLIGRTTTRPPLQFRNIHYDVKERDGDKEILVEADLFNLGASEMPAPNVRVRVVDADGSPLHASVIGPEDMSEAIPAQGSARYFVRIPEPPADFDAVLLNIAAQD